VSGGSLPRFERDHFIEELFLPAFSPLDFSFSDLAQRRSLLPVSVTTGAGVNAAFEFRVVIPQVEQFSESQMFLLSSNWAFTRVASEEDSVPVEFSIHHFPRLA
jgi:hypothetical protein